MLLKPVGFLKSSAGQNPLRIGEEVLFTNDSANTVYTSSSVSPIAGSDRVALLLVGGSSGAAAPSSVSAAWGAQAFTQLGAVTTGTFRGQGAIFYIKEADIPSAATISVTWNATMSSCYAALLQYSGADQTTTFGGTQFSNDTSTSSPLGSYVTMTDLGGLHVGAVFFRATAEDLDVSTTRPVDPTSVLSTFGGDSFGIAQVFPGTIGAPASEILFDAPTDPPSGRARIGCELLPA